ncbi:MAG: hypothetical protein AAFW97_03455 [Pseudomonadota bacterium]
MNTPKKLKRANAGRLEASPDHPAILFFPVSDHVAVYIGHVVTRYTSLERQMIDVFRVILGIESGEAAVLAYMAIQSPKARWDMVKQVLENDHAHAKTPAAYDEIIEEFGAIASFRNSCVHGLWWMDDDDQPWISSTKTPIDILSPRKFAKTEFDDILSRIENLRQKITDVSASDRSILDKRWSKRSQQGRDNNPSTPPSGE